MLKFHFNFCYKPLAIENIPEIIQLCCIVCIYIYIYIFIFEFYIFKVKCVLNYHQLFSIIILSQFKNIKSIHYCLDIEEYFSENTYMLVYIHVEMSFN